jgi:MFS family permease
MLLIVPAIGIATLGTGLFVPVSLLFFTRVADLGLQTVGVLTTAGAVASLPVPFVAGHLTDRVGPRLMTVLGQALQAIGFGGFLVARDPVAVLAVIACVAIGQRVFWSSFFALVAAVPVEGNDGRVRDRRYAIVGMAQAAGFGVGALLAGGLLAASSTSAYLVLAAVNCVTFAVSGVLLLLVRVPAAAPRERHPTMWSSYRHLLGDRPYLVLIGGNVCFAVCSVYLAAALPVYVADGLEAQTWIVGPVLALNTALLATGQLAATRLVTHFTRTGALALSGLAWCAWAVLTALSPAVAPGFLIVWLAGVTLLYGLAELVHAPISNALAADSAPQAQRGVYLSMFQYGFTIATMVVPIGFTSLFVVDPELPWLVVAALAALGSLTMLWLTGRLPREAVRPGFGATEGVTT